MIRIHKQAHPTDGKTIRDIPRRTQTSLAASCNDPKEKGACPRHCCSNTLIHPNVKREGKQPEPTDKKRKANPGKEEARPESRRPKEKEKKKPQSLHAALPQSTEYKTSHTTQKQKEFQPNSRSRRCTKENEAHIKTSPKNAKTINSRLKM